MPSFPLFVEDPLPGDPHGDPPPDPRLAGLQQVCNGGEDPVHTYFP